MSDDQSFQAIEATLKRATAALRDAEVPFLLGGSLASWARGGPETRHDLDLMVKPQDAERALEVLTDIGMRPERPPEGWLFKAWDGEVLVDLIFAPKGLEMTDEVMARGDEFDVLAISTPVMALEDMLATKLLALDEHSLDYSPLLQIVRALREQIDWETVRSLTAGSPYSKPFFVLVEELGIAPAAHAGPRSRVRVVEPATQPR
jgi:putative nucleotidyltransferase-like protein